MDVISLHSSQRQTSPKSSHLIKREGETGKRRGFFTITDDSSSAQLSSLTSGTPPRRKSIDDYTSLLDSLNDNQAKQLTNNTPSQTITTLKELIDKSHLKTNTRIRTVISRPFTSALRVGFIAGLVGLIMGIPAGLAAFGVVLLTVFSAACLDYKNNLKNIKSFEQIWESEKYVLIPSVGLFLKEDMLKLKSYCGKKIPSIKEPNFLDYIRNLYFNKKSNFELFCSEISFPLSHILSRAELMNEYMDEDLENKILFKKNLRMSIEDLIKFQPNQIGKIYHRCKFLQEIEKIENPQITYPTPLINILIKTFNANVESKSVLRNLVELNSSDFYDPVIFE